jgi:hypothetical protein
VRYAWQHAPHTLHPAMIAPHAAVLLRWPQLCGVTHLQLEMHPPADSEPCGSSVHCPVAELQLYMTGVGAGVGMGVGAGVGAGVGTSVLQVVMHWPGDSAPRGSSVHRPIVVLQLYITGVGTGVGSGRHFAGRSSGSTYTQASELIGLRTLPSGAGPQQRPWPSSARLWHLVVMVNVDVPAGHGSHSDAAGPAVVMPVPHQLQLASATSVAFGLPAAPTAHVQHELSHIVGLVCPLLKSFGMYTGPPPHMCPLRVHVPDGPQFCVPGGHWKYSAVHVVLAAHAAFTQSEQAAQLPMLALQQPSSTARFMQPPGVQGFAGAGVGGSGVGAGVGSGVGFGVGGVGGAGHILVQSSGG